MRFETKIAVVLRADVPGQPRLVGKLLQRPLPLRPPLPLLRPSSPSAATSATSRSSAG